MKRPTFWLFLVGLLALVLAACGPQAPQKGSLRITVNAPSGVTPQVQVTGPGNFSRTITTTGETNLTNLDPGNYTIAVTRRLVNGIGYEGNGATVQVQAGATASHTVNYQAVTGKITVTISGLPSGLQAGINIKRSDGTNLNSTPINANTTLEDVPPGNYTVEAPPRTQNGSTYATAANGSTVTVSAGGTATVNATYTLNPGSATITVQGLDGPLPNPVTITLGGGPSSPVSQTFTDNGTVSFSNLAPGTYTISATEITNNGPQDYAFALSKTTLTIASGASDSAILNYSKPTITVNVTGPAASADANIVVTFSGPGSVGPVTLTGTDRTGSVSVPRFGSYDISATALVNGVDVDSFYFTENPASAVLSPSAPSSSASVALTARGETGHIFVAGKGVLGGTGINAALKLADGASSLAPFIPPSGTTPEGIFKVAFDQDGNAYLVYQSNSPGGARIVRVSEANLRAGQLSDTAPGNKVIAGSAFSISASEGGNGEVEPTDLAFDAQGNLWIANDNGSAIACISRAQLTGQGSTITTADQRFGGAGGPPGVYQFVRGLAFDRQGNLWFTSNDFVAADPTRRARLSRLSANLLTCSGGRSAPVPDIQLDISNAAGPGSPIIKPAGLALSPDGNSLWVADYGGSTTLSRCVPPSGPGDTRPSCPVDSTLVVAQERVLDANEETETLIQIDISGLGPTSGLVTATIADRITVQAGAGLDRGLQQPFHIAFDKQGRLWVATNNNVLADSSDTSSPCGFSLGAGEVAVCAPAGVVTDRQGRLYVLPLGGTPSSTPRGVSPVRSFSSGTLQLGFTGVAFNVPPVNAPMYVRPTQ
ncbi:hypothetical protein DV704_05230 [Meiothermus sp. QL-1]|uniref:hypothetical protein n=1 Tax=Meiothermus sp. QL-1 TaxID=2058095 RepID=UPI000E0BC5BE|nr:hypothetical protein [Meiothermus sp. QL-1]RDI95681.1 hypothetical protein DV704_05230 [Meiothermus sp. QL-1]